MYWSECTPQLSFVFQLIHIILTNCEVADTCSVSCNAKSIHVVYHDLVEMRGKCNEL